MDHILYLECYSGISGDMTVGALLDLGADRDVLEKALNSLHIDGYHLHFGHVKKCGIDAFDFDVHLEDEAEQTHGGHEDGEHSHSHAHSHAIGSHSHEEHGHEHGEHNHEHTHTHHHHVGEHVHRNLLDIITMIERLDAEQPVRQLAVRMFEIVAEAESKAHGIPIEEVHFHEVGAVDSIIDIVSVAVCLHNLGITKVIVSPLAEGRGYVRCQHGVMPVPVPATANIAAAHGLELKLTENEGEMVTPTGAAIAAALQSKEKLPEKYRIQKIGVGAGKKDFANANIVRAMLIEPVIPEMEETKAENNVWKLETNLDDCTGENLGFVMEELFGAGALDVWYTPIYMKKNRPAYLLSLLCMETDVKKMEDLLFRHTTTIGIRKAPMERRVLERKTEEIMTSYGNVQVKTCSRDGREIRCPEYESIQEICRRTGEPFPEVMQKVKEECR